MHLMPAAAQITDKARAHCYITECISSLDSLYQGRTPLPLFSLPTPMQSFFSLCCCSQSVMSYCLVL